jgi:hypothetical protein
MNRRPQQQQQQEVEDSNVAAAAPRRRGVQPAPSSLEARSLPGSTTGRMEVFRETRHGWPLLKGEGEGGAARILQPGSKVFAR